MFFAFLKGRTLVFHAHVVCVCVLVCASVCVCVSNEFSSFRLSQSKFDVGVSEKNGDTLK